MPLADRLSELNVVPIEEEYLPLTRPEVAELERRLGSALPADYVEFAMAYGGCRLRDWGDVTNRNHSGPAKKTGW